MAEETFRSALHDLLLYSPDRRTLAQRALGWALRLVEGESAFVIDSDGSILASQGLDSAAAEELAARNDILSVAGQRDEPWRQHHMLTAPLARQKGPGPSALISGRLTPIPGDDALCQ